MSTIINQSNLKINEIMVDIVNKKGYTLYNISVCLMQILRLPVQIMKAWMLSSEL